MDLKEFNRVIDAISHLKEGETIDSFDGSVQNKAYWSTTFYRTLYGDSRKRVCQYIDGIVNQLITIIISDKTLREEYIQKVIPLQSGLRILVSTYSDDFVEDHINPLIAELDLIQTRFKSIEIKSDPIELKVSTHLEPVEKMERIEKIERIEKMEKIERIEHKKSNPVKIPESQNILSNELEDKLCMRIRKKVIL